ncbi:hypothetical protein PC116_g27627 [Phytophthora cactorum]|nr:hypothetical protein PC113_g23195 [Phytophthora cactorum]KAG2963150.1 hypothetical protein PC119_g25602 [Phytophthora cactorum]KAG4223911.1 hypothetical protein PC116_g27627 [Phytophthora cactorum]
MATGWTSKPPCGLARGWSYTSPDGAKVLVGESAVVPYALESGLLVENESAQDDVAVDEDVMVERLSSFVVEVERCVSEERKEGEGVTDEPVAHDEGLSDSCEDGIRASQIDTSAQLSQGTLNAMFGSSSESEERALPDGCGKGI